jgi:hypothetical protein
MECPSNRTTRFAIDALICVKALALSLLWRINAIGLSSNPVLSPIRQIFVSARQLLPAAVLHDEASVWYSSIVQGGGKLREKGAVSPSESGVISSWRRVDANRCVFQPRCYGLAHSETECVIPVPVTGPVLRLV